MKYNVLKLVTNTSDQYVAEVTATYDNITSAKVTYHNLLAALHNAEDCKIAVIKIEDEFGHEVSGFMETVDHRESEEVI